MAACFPLLVAEQPMGALYVYALESDSPFSSLELLVLENFVNQAAMAIYQPRRLAGVQHNLARKEEELNRLRRAGLLISSRLGLEETLEAILQMALEVTGAHYGIFRLVDKSGQNLITRAIAGESLGRPLVEALPIERQQRHGLGGAAPPAGLYPRPAMPSPGCASTTRWMPIWRCAPSWPCR